MRQVGILAAAGRYALAHNIERLADDHLRAAQLAEALGGAPTQTNIVVLHAPDAPTVAGKAAEQDVLVAALGPQFLRLVTHLDIDDAGVQRAIDVLAPLLDRR